MLKSQEKFVLLQVRRGKKQTNDRTTTFAQDLLPSSGGERRPYSPEYANKKQINPGNHGEGPKSRKGEEPNPPRDYVPQRDETHFMGNVEKVKPILWEMLKKFGMKKETITILKGLHEYTTYEVRGREANSTTWMPLRGLREGCATSPGLFNVSHATSIRIATKTRQERARQPIGAPWQWSPENSFPLKDMKKARGNSATRVVRLTEVLFADDTTLIGKKSEIENGEQTVMEILGRFEEMCHPDKEEHLALGTANDIRSLGSYADRKIDLTMRLQRMRRAAFIVKKD